MKKVKAGSAAFFINTVNTETVYKHKEYGLSFKKRQTLEQNINLWSNQAKRNLMRAIS